MIVCREARRCRGRLGRAGGRRARRGSGGGRRAAPGPPGRAGLGARGRRAEGRRGKKEERPGSRPCAIREAGGGRPPGRWRGSRATPARPPAPHARRDTRPSPTFDPSGRRRSRAPRK